MLKYIIIVWVLSTISLSIFLAFTSKYSFQIRWTDVHNGLNFQINEYAEITRQKYLDHVLNQDWNWKEIKELAFIGLNESLHATQFAVYSAYLYSYKNQTVLRIIGIIPASFFESKKYNKTTIQCSIFDTQRNIIGSCPATIHAHKFATTMYRDVFFLCQLDYLLKSFSKNQLLQEMGYVSIFSNKTLYNPSNIVPITHQLPNNVKERYKFSVCVQPTFDYDRVFEFVQWIEFHKMMGVSHFTFYNVSIGRRVSCAMKSKALQTDAELIILNWTLPIRNRAFIHANGQNSQMSDCNYRYRGVTKYIVVVDLDEVIVPTVDYAKNYEDLIKLIDQSGNYTKDSVAQYNFRSGFFVENCDRNGPLKVAKLSKCCNCIQLNDLYMHKYIKRQQDLFLHKDRSKYISIPHRVVRQETHFLWEAVGNAKELHIPQEIAFLHHYRSYEIGNKTNCTDSLLDDYSAHYYTQELLGRVRKIMWELNKECDLTE